MGFIKNAIAGIVIYEAIRYLTKKDASGKTKLDELEEQVPEWLEKAKAVTTDLKSGQLPQL